MLAQRTCVAALHRKGRVRRRREQQWTTRGPWWEGEGVLYEQEMDKRDVGPIFARSYKIQARGVDEAVEDEGINQVQK